MQEGSASGETLVGAGMCMLLALLLALWAGVNIAELLRKPTMKAVIAERAAVATWPETSATLYRLNVVEERSGRGPGVRFYPYVNYRYTIESRKYEGDTLTYDQSWKHVFGATNSGDFKRNLQKLVPTLEHERFRKATQCQNIPSYESCTFT